MKLLLPLTIALFCATTALAGEKPTPRAKPVNPSDPEKDQPWLKDPIVLANQGMVVTVCSSPSNSTLIVHINDPTSTQFKGDLLLTSSGTTWAYYDGRSDPRATMAIPPHSFSYAQVVALEIYVLLDEQTGKRSLGYNLVPLFGSKWRIPIKSVQVLHETKM